MFRWIVSYIVLSHYLQLSYSMTSRIIPRALSEVSTTSPKQFKVAVIGAGAAGLVTARALSSKHGIQVTVLEKNKNVGGVWAYEKSKHRPMYKNLRTNLPKEIMAFREFPFNSDTNVKSPSFVTHKDVQRYLMSYCDKFDLEKLIQFGSQVEQLRICVEHKSSIVEEWPQIELAWVQNGTRHSQTFDAVCVCNGHYAAPSIPTIQGIEYFKGETLHSIEQTLLVKFQLTQRRSIYQTQLVQSLLSMDNRISKGMCCGYQGQKPLIVIRPSYFNDAQKLRKSTPSFIAQATITNFLSSMKSRIWSYLSFRGSEECHHCTINCGTHIIQILHLLDCNIQ
jgi:hypothetical protein